ncbi:hypothetical protein [Rhodovulum sp.]|uniref:hypothetical protein n=1 Tax=Rhodovulum sp. TaxID=34009 RepID=UPI001857AA11|nr:hypothetical protein [Rhodovulum sp.]HDR29806.1 hypothetical protein [Rhodovulum sp.]
MAWKWYEIETCKASVGGPAYYGLIQLNGPGFQAGGRSQKRAFARCLGADHLWPASPRLSGLPADAGDAGHLRNEAPVRFGWNDANPNDFHLMTGNEPVGEGDGVLARGG